MGGMWERGGLVWMLVILLLAMALSEYSPAGAGKPKAKAASTVGARRSRAPFLVGRLLRCRPTGDAFNDAGCGSTRLHR